jgi:Zn-dependent protease
MDVYNILIKIAIYAIPIIFAITLHEAAHGYVARHFGDNTAYMLGRVTLNPAKHIDPIGTVAFPLLTVILSGYMFGWAKPVPVNERNLRDPKRDMLWVAAAGPVSNLIQMVVWATVAKLLLSFFENAGSLVADYWFSVAMAGVTVNVVFAILNLFPIPPLDGGRMVIALLPGAASYKFAQIERYGFFIVLLLVMIPAVNQAIFLPPVLALTNFTINVFGLNV